MTFANTEILILSLMVLAVFGGIYLSTDGLSQRIYKIKLFYLQRAREKTDRTFRKLMAAAEKEKDHDNYNEVRSEASHNWIITSDEIDIFITSELRKRAERVFVSMPNRKDDILWRGIYYDDDTKVLTKAGIIKIQDDIREEKRKEYEVRNLSIDPIVKIVAAITGLCGVIAGILALLKK